MASIGYVTQGINRAKAATAGARGVGGGVRVLGVEECLIKLGLVNKVARIHLGYLVHKAAEDIAEQARENIHDVTGNLSSGTKAAPAGPYHWTVTSSSMAGDVAGKNNYEYAGYVEFGTSKTGHDFPSFAYMTRAYQAELPDIAAGLKVIGSMLERL